jgi:hypothetical protein
MRRQGRDWLGIALATAGVVGAISLAGIFIVYLVDSLNGDDNGSKSANASKVGTVGPGPTAATGATGLGKGATGLGSTSTGAGTKTGATGGAVKTQNPARIPDGQRYETYTNQAAGYSILAPKGWKKKTKGKLVGFSHKFNFELLASAKGPAPTTKSVSKQLGKNPNLSIIDPPKTETVAGMTAVVVRARNTKRNIILLQYHFGKNKKTAAINLGTPETVYKDNADDLRRIANSFRWL